MIALKQYLVLSEAAPTKDEKAIIWGSFDSLVQDTDLDYKKVKALTGSDMYPRIGTISLARGYYSASIGNISGDTVTVTLHVDVDTSNELHRSSNPERAKKIADEAKTIADKLSKVKEFDSVKVVPYTNKHAAHQNMAPDIEVKYKLPPGNDKPVGKSSGAPYNAHDAYMNRRTPAAKAGDSRRAGHQFAGDIGGSSSNYR